MFLSHLKVSRIIRGEKTIQIIAKNNCNFIDKPCHLLETFKIDFAYAIITDQARKWPHINIAKCCQNVFYL